MSCAELAGRSAFRPHTGDESPTTLAAEGQSPSEIGKGCSALTLTSSQLTLTAWSVCFASQPFTARERRSDPCVRIAKMRCGHSACAGSTRTYTDPKGPAAGLRVTAWYACVVLAVFRLVYSVGISSGVSHRKPRFSRPPKLEHPTAFPAGSARTSREPQSKTVVEPIETHLRAPAGRPNGRRSRMPSEVVLSQPKGPRARQDGSLAAPCRAAPPPGTCRRSQRKRR